MNDFSSRSHLIMTILIDVVDKRTGQKSSGKLSFVDLAGCERAAKSKVGKDRIKETMSINKSLSAISSVIYALSRNERYIPYRNH
jgi:kinesin family protein C2/C3